MTLNQVIKRFKTYANNHEMINDFFYGIEGELLSQRDIKYTVCLLELVKTNISREQRRTPQSSQKTRPSMAAFTRKHRQPPSIQQRTQGRPYHPVASR